MRHICPDPMRKRAVRLVGPVAAKKGTARNSSPPTALSQVCAWMKRRFGHLGWR
ncbi:hypothetical protein [Erythrobacter litoralis]|uniref:hypothetical protein n=1 Tax=Erythrobacter litoralis TaxID=39960 RepID=UPI003AABFF23